MTLITFLHCDMFLCLLLLDPFGHSATQAALLSGVVGFEALFFGRIDHQDHDQRMQDKNMEFIWLEQKHHRGLTALQHGLARSHLLLYCFLCDDFSRLCVH